MFIEAPSLGALPDKTEELHLLMRHGYFMLDTNPVFIWHIIIIFIIIIITIIIITIIIELTHSKVILEITVEIKPQPAALDFKNLSQYSSRSR